MTSLVNKHDISNPYLIIISKPKSRLSTVIVKSLMIKLNYETKNERHIMLYSPFLSDYNVLFDLINNLAWSHSLLTSVKSNIKRTD